MTRDSKDSVVLRRRAYHKIISESPRHWGRMTVDDLWWQQEPLCHGSLDHPAGRSRRELCSSINQTGSLERLIERHANAWSGAAPLFSHYYTDESSHGIGHGRNSCDSQRGQVTSGRDRPSNTPSWLFSH